MARNAADRERRRSCGVVPGRSGVSRAVHESQNKAGACRARDRAAAGSLAAGSSAVRPRAVSRTACSAGLAVRVRFQDCVSSVRNTLRRPLAASRGSGDASGPAAAVTATAVTAALAGASDPGKMLAVVGVLPWLSCGMATAVAYSAAMSAGSTAARFPGDDAQRMVAASARMSARAAWAGWGLGSYMPAAACPAAMMSLTNCCAARTGWPGASARVRAAVRSAPQRGGLTPMASGPGPAQVPGRGTCVSGCGWRRCIRPHCGQASARSLPWLRQANDHPSRHDSCHRPPVCARHSGQNREPAARPHSTLRTTCPHWRSRRSAIPS